MNLLAEIAKTAPLAILIANFGCSSSEISADHRALIDEYIVGIDPLLVSEANVEAGPTSAGQRQGDFSCTTTNVAETRSYDRLVAYAANSDSLWPGAIVGGNSLQTGQLTQIQFERAPINISVSLSNLVGSKSASVEEPQLSSYRDAVAGILSSELSGATPANIYAEIEEVHSLQQLSLAMGLDVTFLAGGLATVGASFDFNSEEVRSRFVVKYTQAYYTVDVDQPETPSAFLADNVSIFDVEKRIAPLDPPMYVSSVTYGRTILFTFESSYSSSELSAALDFAYRGGVDVKGNVSVSYKDVLSSSKINAYILGGSGGEAAKAIDNFEALMDFIHGGGNYSPESPGSPIAYKLNYMRDNQPARISLTEDFVVRDCARVSQKILVTLRNFEVVSTSDGGNNLEIFGSVSAEANNEGVLFDRPSEEQVTVAEGKSWPSTGSIAEVVLDVTPEAGQEIILHTDLWDKDGFLQADDSLGTESVSILFETGWRREVSILLTGDNSVLKVNLELQPI